MEKLNELMKNLFAQFADKNQTNKRLGNIEKNVTFKV